MGAPRGHFSGCPSTGSVNDSAVVGGEDDGARGAQTIGVGPDVVVEPDGLGKNEDTGHPPGIGGGERQVSAHGAVRRQVPADGA